MSRRRQLAGGTADLRTGQPEGEHAGVWLPMLASWSVRPTEKQLEEKRSRDRPGLEAALAKVDQPFCALQRTHEERRALFSCFYWAIFSWNRDEMGSQGEPPQLALWARLLVRCCCGALGSAWVQEYPLHCLCLTRLLWQLEEHMCMWAWSPLLQCAQGSVYARHTGMHSTTCSDDGLCRVTCRPAFSSAVRRSRRCSPRGGRS